MHTVRALLKAFRCSSLPFDLFNFFLTLNAASFLYLYEYMCEHFSYYGKFFYARAFPASLQKTNDYAFTQVLQHSCENRVENRHLIATCVL